MSAVLQKAAAAWLLVLTLSPFTAPFPTCDLATFVTGSEGHERSSPATVIARRIDAAVSQIVGICRDAGRVRFVALFGHGTPQAVANHFTPVLRRPGASSGGSPASPHRAVLRI